MGTYTVEQFKGMARTFHGYAAPGILVGGFMVTLARSMLPPGTLFEALVETPKCLPDAVQLLTPCSTGNRWMKVLDLGRYAVTLCDKFTGEGWRVSIDVERLKAWPEIRAWFLKLKPKKSQDTERLFQEIEEAGESVLSLQAVQVDGTWRSREESGGIAICPRCGEAYPEQHGDVCRACAGPNPYAGSVRHGEESSSSVPGRMHPSRRPG